MFSKKAEIQENVYTPPADVNVAILHTIIAVTALRDVLLKETDALKQSKTSLFLELQDEKVDAARRYELLVTNLMNRGAEIKSADPKLKEQLQRLQTDFSKVAAENVEWIERMKTATKRLGETIMKNARRALESQSQFAYGSSGVMQRGNKTLAGFDERA